MAAFVVEQDKFIVVGIDRRLHQIGGEQWQFFATTLRFGILFELFTFRGKSDAERWIRPFCHRLDDVRIQREFQCRNAAFLLYFMCTDIGDVIIRNCGDGIIYPRSSRERLPR